VGSAGLVLVEVGGGLTVVLMVVELDLVAEDVLVVVAVLVVEEDLLVEEDTEVDVVEETVLEDEEPEPEPGLGNVDPMSPQRTLLCRAEKD
jgi:hypothetical protein